MRDQVTQLARINLFAGNSKRACEVQRVVASVKLRPPAWGLGPLPVDALVKGLR